MGRRLFVWLQYLLPQHLLTALVHRVTRSERPAVRRALVRGFRRLYAVDLDEAAEPDAERYASFNEFFTRALKPGARPIAPGPLTLASPCDGTVSERGAIEGERLLQARLAAKSRWYTLSELLGDPARAAPFAGGEFATIYLAPHNYHRVHMPLAGTLTSVHYVPGALFSVNGATAATVPRLFARNERVACLFDTAAGPLAVVFVGALNVGSIGLVGYGDLTPRRPREALSLPPPPSLPGFLKGAELGRFNMGSTIILLLARGAVAWLPRCVAGGTVRMGEALGECRGK
ncbi:MAG TPA: archaetidylserine decarboxylase [Steroidobacteraceae bacterium]|nr:archaetidylserine decarboxylase [Steroidobacteraceae bacterium]